MKWIATLLLLTPSIAAAETEPEFHLCAHYVQKSEVGEQAGGGWPVIVKLTALGTKSFEKFTEANVGRMSRIIVDGRQFLRATIREPISEGTLYGEFSSREIASAWQRAFVDESTSAPCGAN